MKIISSVLVCAVILLGFSGCASLFETEVHETTEFHDDSSSSMVSAGVSSYEGIKSVLDRLIRDYQTEGVIKLRSYEGDVDVDISRAIREAKNTAIGAYCIEDIYYKPSQIISYYEAKVSIIYRRTKEQIDSIIEAKNELDVEREITKLFNIPDYTVTIEVRDEGFDLEFITAAVGRQYREEHPGLLSMPVIEYVSYPDKGDIRIIEVSFSEVLPERIKQAMENELAERLLEIADIADDVRSENATDMKRFLTAVDSLVTECEYYEALEPDADETKLQYVSSAYGALVENKGDSEGYALGVSSIADILSEADDAKIESIVVQGEFKGKPHCWNIISVDGVYSHLDCSQLMPGDTDLDVLKSDDQMLEEYKWDREAYPACEKAKASGDEQDT